MTELQLIAGCKERRRDSQKLLYERYAPKIYGVCLRYCQDIEAAQDLLHDGFIKIFSIIDSYMGKGSFEGWMKRVFINMALENIRKDKVQQRTTDDIDNVPDIVDEETEVANSISEDDLMRMIESLPKGYRTVFNLYAIEDFSHKEIAQLLNISEGTSRSQYIRARQILQEKVKAFIKE